MATFRWASSVEAPRWGVQMKFSNRSSGWSGGTGSVANTSNAAPPRCPEVSASCSASSSTTPPRGIGGDVGIEGQDLHLHPQATFDDHRSDVSDSNHAERLVEQLATLELLLLPLSVLDAGGGLWNVPRKGHHHCHRELGHGDRVSSGSVHHHHALLGGFIQIDVVDADACAADHLELSP